MPSFKSGKKDLLIMAGLLIVALVIWGGYTFLNRAAEPEGMYAQIIYDGELIEKAYLDKERTFSISEQPNIEFEIKDRKISFKQSDCPDQVCVLTGWLDTHGHFAACLPHKVMLFVVDEESKKN